MRWLMTIAYRIRPGNTEWQYKSIVTRKPPEKWLADRLDAVELGDVPRLDVNVLYAREIDDASAEVLAERLDARNERR